MNTEAEFQQIVAFPCCRLCEAEYSQEDALA